MMTTRWFTVTGHGGTMLPAVIWNPEGETKAVLHIVHGMTEHMGRYETLAAALCQQGIAVAGFDLRGHGKHTGNPQIASFGAGGWMASVEDIHLFVKELQQQFPNLPYFMMGFSLGPCLLHDYLRKNTPNLAGVIIAGNGHQPGWLLSMMMAIVKSQIKAAGPDGTTDLVRKLSFGTYNQKFQPNRTNADWLCGDEQALDLYLADPLVRPDISASLFWELMDAMKRISDGDCYAGWPKETPVLLLYGTDDPVCDGGKGVQRLYKRMKKAGLQNVECQQFPHARHDIFHEEASGTADMVRRCITHWLQEKLQ